MGTFCTNPNIQRFRERHGQRCLRVAAGPLLATLAQSRNLAHASLETAVVNCSLQGDVHQEAGVDPAGGGGEGEEAHLRRGSAPSPRQRPLLRLGEGRAGTGEHHALLQVAKPFGEQSLLLKSYLPP